MGCLHNKFVKAREGDLSIHKEVSALAVKSAHEALLSKRHIHMDLKNGMFEYCPEILLAEAQQLLFTLNVVKPENVSEKALILGLWEILKERKTRERLESLLHLKFWATCKKILYEYKPKNHAANYKQNLDKFLNRATRL